MTQLTPLVIFCRRLFIGTTAAYLFASFSLGGSRAARPVFYALIFGWVIFLYTNPTRARGRCRRSLSLARRVRVLGPSPAAPDIATGSNPLARVIRYLELFGFNVALTLVLAEFSLRACALLWGSSLLISQTLDAYRLVPGRDYGAGLRGNSLGYPGAEFRQEKHAGVYRIAALGDSCAVGPAVSFADNYLTLLQADQPGIEVYNFGVSGTGPREYHTILRQHALAFQPDLVLVSVFVGNDITESLATPRHLHPRQHSLYLLFDRSFRLVRERWRRAEEQPEAVSDRLAAGALAPETFREVEARRLAVCLETPPPGLERKWQRALGYLDRIVKDCQQWRVPVACILIPDEFQVNPDVLADALGAAPMDTRMLDLDKPQRRLVSFFAERRVPCLDLLPSFKGVPNTYALRDTHWNVRGNRLAAERISNWLRTIREGAGESSRKFEPNSRDQLIIDVCAGTGHQ